MDEVSGYPPGHGSLTLSHTHSSHDDAHPAPSDLILHRPIAHTALNKMHKLAVDRTPHSPLNASSCSASGNAPATDISAIQIRKTHAHEVAVVGDLLVAGFWNDPAWMLMDLHEQHADAEQFIFHALAKLLLHDASYVVCYGDEIIGHLCMQPPNRSAVPPVWQIWSAAWSVPFRFGWAFTQKLASFLYSIGVQTDPYLLPLQPAAMLEWFTIKPEWRGKGVGLHVLETFVATHYDRVVLLTQSHDCVRLYERAGFHTLQQFTLHSSGDDATRQCACWSMIYTQEWP